MFTYIHKDGRTGRSVTVWRAIAAALDGDTGKVAGYEPIEWRDCDDPSFLGCGDIVVCGEKVGLIAEEKYGPH